MGRGKNNFQPFEGQRGKINSNPLIIKIDVCDAQRTDFLRGARQRLRRSINAIMNSGADYGWEEYKSIPIIGRKK
jgi:hypothetical protein